MRLFCRNRLHFATFRMGISESRGSRLLKMVNCPRLLIFSGSFPLHPLFRPLWEVARNLDCYICPNDQVLQYHTTNCEGYREYRSNSKFCAQCPYLAQCTAHFPCYYGKQTASTRLSGSHACLLLTLRRTEHLIGLRNQERFITLLTQPKGMRLIRHLQVKHHLDIQQQGVKIPHQHRPVPKLQMIGRGIALKGSHAGLIQLPRCLIQRIGLIIMKSVEIASSWGVIC